MQRAAAALSLILLAATPLSAQPRGQPETVYRPFTMDPSRFYLSNYDRIVNGSDASTPGRN